MVEVVAERGARPRVAVNAASGEDEDRALGALGGAHEGVEIVLPVDEHRRAVGERRGAAVLARAEKGSGHGGILGKEREKPLGLERVGIARMDYGGCGVVRWRSLIPHPTSPGESSNRGFETLGAADRRTRQAAERLAARASGPATAGAPSP